MELKITERGCPLITSAPNTVYFVATPSLNTPT